MEFFAGRFRLAAREGNMRAYWVIGILVAAGLGADAEGCTVTVSVHAAPRFGTFDLKRAESAAAEIFSQAGVAVRWRSSSVRATAANDDCGAPIEVEIQETADRMASPSALANAAPFAKSGTRIHVFADRVAETCGGRLCQMVLTYVLAHEIAHVLEGANRHSAEGIMKASWESSDYRRMKSHSLFFTAEDVELIHLGLASRRLRAAAAD
jgi:Zn-dependent protease with chaperone function